MLQAIGNEELQKQFQNILKPFYGALKTKDGYIKFALLTGVTKDVYKRQTYSIPILIFRSDSYRHVGLHR